MTSQVGTNPRAVSVSGGFLWRPMPPGLGSMDQVVAGNENPLAEEWARRLDPLSVRAAWCVGKARTAAGVPDPSARPNTEGVCMATAMGAQQTRMRYASRLASHGLGGTNPIDFPDSIDGAPAAHVALRWHLQGPIFTFVGGIDCAHRALVVAARQLALGAADRMHVVLGDVFDPRARAVLSSALERQEPPLRAPGDQVLALVLERSPTSLQQGIFLTGFDSSSPALEAGDSNPKVATDALGTEGLLRVTDAWVGLVASMGSQPIACQDALMRDERCHSLDNPWWPRLAFVCTERP